MNDIKVSELSIYPVKSLARIELSSSLIDTFGLSYDRRWMLVDHQNRYITQRQHARMCLIQTRLNAKQLTLCAPDMPDIVVTQPSNPVLRQVTIWDDQCSAIDCGNNVADWLSQFLGINCRLVYFPDNEVRIVDPTYAQTGDTTAFSDGFPILLISQASLDDLNNRLENPVPMARFRPNIVVSGCAPFAEDNWKKIRIGDLSFRLVKPCSRCIMPTINIDNAEKSPEPIRTLSTYRKHNNKVFFGQNVIADNTGTISLNMPVEVIE